MDQVYYDVKHVEPWAQGEYTITIMDLDCVLRHHRMLTLAIFFVIGTYFVASDATVID